MGLHGWGYLPVRVRTSFRRSTVNAMLAAMTMRPSVAARLPGATQLMQLPIIAGASCIEPPLLLKNKDLTPYMARNFEESILHAQRDSAWPYRAEALNVAPHPCCREKSGHAG
jgi:hypothetical protein